jgi:hypothetical protein
MKMIFIFLIMASGIIMIGRGLLLLLEGSVGETYDPILATVYRDMVVMILGGTLAFTVSVFELNRKGKEIEAST